MRLIDTLAITVSLLVAMSGIAAVMGGLTAWFLLATVVGVWVAMTFYERAAARDFPDGILSAIPDPADLLAMFPTKKD
jgi:hypothetical protein